GAFAEPSGRPAQPTPGGPGPAGVAPLVLHADLLPAGAGEDIDGGDDLQAAVPGDGGHEGAVEAVVPERGPGSPGCAAGWAGAVEDLAAVADVVGRPGQLDPAVGVDPGPGHHEEPRVVRDRVGDLGGLDRRA